MPVLRGLYAAAAAMMVQSARHETASANLIHAQTPGYRARRIALTPFAQLLLARLGGAQAVPLGRLTYGVIAARRSLDAAPGPLRETGRPLDVALVGEGFLAVQAPAGERYTRDGRLYVDAQGLLVDAAGHPVLGEEGPVRVPPGSPVSIEADGTVLVGERPAGRLRLVRFARPEGLAGTDDGLYAATAQSGPPEPDRATRVHAGFLEMANVDPAEEAVELLSALRAFEAAQRVIQAQDATLGLATGELARL